MKDLLWISKSVPYDSVPHAGGKSHNYYVKTIHKNNNINLKLVSFAKYFEKEKIDLDDYGIKNIVFFYPHKGIKLLVRRLVDSESVINPWNRNGCLTRNYEEITIKKAIKKIKNSGYNPDVIILEWTQIVLLISIIKKYFPKSYIIGVEVDVAYLGYERKYKNSSNIVSKLFRKIQYNNLKKRELSALALLDEIAVNNVKDKRLLVNAGVEECSVFVLPPYFNKLNKIQRAPDSNMLLFYGAMSRQENWKSAIWFIKNVLSKIEDKDVKLYVVGSNPPQELLKYACDRVIVTGFVDDVVPYFEKSLCMVCPLLLGAGVKVKVLEAMSAGLPVLGNEIAFEGIEAKDKEDFIFCNTPESFLVNIKLLREDNDLVKTIGENSRNYIDTNYDIRKNASLLCDKIIHSK